MTEKDPSTPFAVRSAGPRDIQRVARLLPYGMENPTRTRYYAVEHTQTGELLGTAYLFFEAVPQAGRRGRFRLAVSKETGEQDLGQVKALLISCCVAQSRSGGAHSLAHHGLVDEGSGLDELLKKHAFSPRQRLSHYHGDISVSLKHLNATHQWLVNRGKIPENSSLVSLDQVSPAPVTQVIQRVFGTRPHYLDLQLDSGMVSDELSTVILDGPRIAGVMLVTALPDEARVLYYVIDQKYRSSWRSIALLRETLLKAYQAGYHTVSGSTDTDHSRNMAHLWKRIGAKEVGRKIFYALEL